MLVDEGNEAQPVAQGWRMMSACQALAGTLELRSPRPMDVHTKRLGKTPHRRAIRTMNPDGPAIQGNLDVRKQLVFTNIGIEVGGHPTLEVQRHGSMAGSAGSTPLAMAMER